MSSVVLDASALLTVLNGETGSDKVIEVLPGAVMNTVNLSEVVAKLVENDMPEKAALEAIDELDFLIKPFDEEMAYKAAFLRPATKNIGLSLGDRACLATGLILRLPVITADRVWRKLTLPLEIQLIR